ncbi:MAG TPA: condensation domain-containing protein, partial [Pyrinomonadaceae bacterium]
KALPEPEAARREPGREYVAPRTPVEEMLCEMWGEVLGLERVGIHDDFFELGGHSLLATQLVSRVRAAFGVELPLRTLFETPNVEGEATEIEVALRGGQGAQAPPIVRVPHDRELPLSFAQQRLWFLDQLEPGGSAYNMPFALRLTGRLDAPALERTVGEVVRRHEVLRTRFLTTDGRAVPHVEQATPASLPLIDLGGADEGAREAEARRLTRAEARRPFDLNRDTPLRARLLRLSAEEHVLLLTMHHIAGDGWSVGVLTREVAALYEAYARGEESPLPELPVQYADYAAWQRGWLQGEVLERQLSYWRGQLEGVPVLELPADHPRPATLTHRGAYVAAEIPPELLDGLRRLSRREGATLFMTLLAAFQTLLSRYSGQSDVCVGMPIAGRNRAETEGLIGLFVNTLALRSSLTPREGFRQLMKRVRETCLGAYAHQDVPFEKLVEELQPERSLNHTPLFQVMFGLQTMGRGEGLTLPGLSLQALEGDGGSAKFDLTLTAVEGEEKLTVVFNYKTDLFDAATVERMNAHFQTLLRGVVANPDARLSELPLLTEEERRRLVLGCNDTARDYPAGESVHGLFERQVSRTPVSIALTFGGETLTYSELNARANRLAHYLRRQGV